MGLMYKIKKRRLASRTPITFERAMPVFQYTRRIDAVSKEAYLILWVPNRSSQNKKLKWKPDGTSYHRLRGRHDKRKTYAINEFTNANTRTATTFTARHFDRMTVNLIHRILEETSADQLNVADRSFNEAEAQLRPACLGYSPGGTRRIKFGSQRHTVKTNVKSFNRVNGDLHREWRDKVEETDAWKKATIEAHKLQRRLFTAAPEMRVSANNPLVKSLTEWCRYVFSNLMGLRADAEESDAKGYWRTIRVGLNDPVSEAGVVLTERVGDYPDI